MIELPKELLRDQAGMDKVLELYFEKLHRDCEGTFNALLGLKEMSVDYEKKQFTAAIDVEKWMVNPNDQLHGGITAALADTVMGLASRFFSEGSITPTIHMDITYLNPVHRGDRLFCRAECTKLGFRVDSAVVRMWVAGQENVTAATATATYYVRRSKS